MRSPARTPTAQSIRNALAEIARLEEAGEYDITIEQGSGFTLPLRHEAPEGTPVDFTGSTARMHVHPKFGSPTVLIELTDDDGIELGDDGTIVLTRSADITAALKFSSGVYDLEITPPVGEPYKLLRGNVFLKREVTI